MRHRPAADLNQLTVDYSPLVGDLLVGWNWDVISKSGGDTADACSLYDALPSPSSARRSIANPQLGAILGGSL